MDWQEVFIFILFVFSVIYLINLLKSSFVAKNTGCNSCSCGSSCPSKNIETILKKAQKSNQSTTLK